MVVFTKFDGLVSQEYAKLDNINNWKDRLKEAKENAKKTFQQVYASSVMNTEYPPKVHVQLGGRAQQSTLFWDKVMIMIGRYAQARE